MTFLNKIGKLIVGIGFLILLFIFFFSIEIKHKQIEMIKEYEMNYIKIDSVKILNVIVDGITKEKLNNNYACLEKLDSNIIIAGHGILPVFQNLSNIENDDIITVSYNGMTENYYVINKYIVNINDFNYFKEKNSLILITCIDNDNRLIIVSKKMA